MKKGEIPQKRLFVTVADEIALDTNRRRGSRQPLFGFDYEPRRKTRRRTKATANKWWEFWKWYDSKVFEDLN